MKRVTIGSSLVVALVLLLSAANVAHATVQYVAKFVCGADPQDAIVRIVPGFYATSVIMLNISGSRARVRLRIVQTFSPSSATKQDVDPFDLGTGDVSNNGTVQGGLGHGKALQIDCEEILDVLGGGPPYRQGLFIIHSSRKLDVRAIYTVAEEVEVYVEPGETTLVRKPVSVDVEQIKGRKIRDRRGNDDDDDD